MPKIIKKRRTQAERSAQMRARLIEAAIRCLDKRGFAATTTLLVAKEAKVSRGAMLHHFPTRTDLLLSVVKAVFEEDAKKAAELLNDPGCTSEMLMENLWNSLIRPAGTAVREILQGVRGDRVLSRKLANLQRQLERDSLRMAAKIEKLDDMSGDTFRALAGIRLVHWCLRGLSNAKTLYENPDDIEQIWSLFKEMIFTFQRLEVGRSAPVRESPSRGLMVRKHEMA